jgi:hypothetical protein
MSSLPLKTKLAWALLALALLALAVAATIAAPAAYPQPRDSAPIAPPPSLMAASVGMEYGDLRARDAQDATVASRPVVAEPSDRAGFDWLSAAIGAAVAAGLSLVSMAVVGRVRAVGRRAASA